MATMAYDILSIQHLFQGSILVPVPTELFGDGLLMADELITARSRYGGRMHIEDRSDA